MRTDSHHLVQPGPTPNRQRHWVLSVILVTGTLLFPASRNSAAQDDEAAIPGIEALEGLGTLVGEWSMSGLAQTDTDDDAGSDSVGRMFQARQSIQWIEPGRSLGVVWSVMVEDGTVITSGRGRINWDDIAGAVVNTYRGEEDGRPFTGSATLIAAGDGAYDWRGHETSGTSESVNFEVTYTFPNDDLCMVDFIPTCIDGDVELDPARFSWKRVNPFHEVVPFAPDLLGEWVLRSGGSEFIPDGSRMNVRSGQGGRSLSFIVLEPGRDGDFIAMEMLWLDDSSGDLDSRLITSDGRMGDGSPSVDRRDGRMALRVLWGGDAPGDQMTSKGEPASLISWMTLDQGRIEVNFSLLGSGGQSMPDDSRVAMIWEPAGG